MAQNRAQSTAISNCQPQRQSYKWLPTASGVLALTVGLQGNTTIAVGALSASSPELDHLTNQREDTIDVSADIETVSPIEPPLQRPKFSQFKSRAQRLLKTDVKSAPNLSLDRLQNHRRTLHRRSNEVESQLLSLQQLLSIQSYGTSFADRLLDEDDVYQTKLQQLQALEAEIHVAIEQADTVKFSQIQSRLRGIDQELKQLAQKQLQQYIAQAQTSSTLGLWQEPMYRESLRWLMEHTHERHLLKARQQTLARTLIAVSPN